MRHWLCCLGLRSKSLAPSSGLKERVFEQREVTIRL